MSKYIAILLLSLLSVGPSWAQSSARAKVSVTIMEPVGASKLEDLSFGSFSATSRPGTLELQSLGVRRIQGGIRLPQADTTARLAMLQLTNPSLAYSVTIPSEPILVKRRGGTETMSVGAFTVSTSEQSRGEIPTHTIAIGATLQTGAFQISGDYHPATPLMVVINYN